MRASLFPDIQFADPLWLLLLLLLPVMAWLRGRPGQAPSVVFPAISLIRDLGSRSRSGARRFFLGLILASIACAIVALARPQRVKSYDEVKTEGIAIALTVDVSLSMLIEDFFISGKPVNRLTAAKRVMRDFIRGRKSDRIGIVTFAGAPYYPCPLTLDHDWLETNIERVQTGVMRMVLPSVPASLLPPAVWISKKCPAKCSSPSPTAPTTQANSAPAGCSQTCGNTRHPRLRHLHRHTRRAHDPPP